MDKILQSVKLPVIIGFLTTFPFVILELANRRNFDYEFPFFLFLIMWLMSTLFVIFLVPIVRDVRAGNNSSIKPINLFIRFASMLLIAFIWTGIVLDQMPCFLGIPNCD